MTPAGMKEMVDTLEALSSVRAGNLSEAGWWQRAALAAEDLASSSTTANDNTFGYMLRTALALEAIEGGSGAEENMTASGYLKRIADALELSEGVTTGSWSKRILAALATWTGPGAAVIDSDGNSFSTSFAVLDSDDNSFTVSSSILDSDGNAFSVI